MITQLFLLKKKLEVIKNKSIANKEIIEIKTDPNSNNEDENENKNKRGKRLNRRKKRSPKQDKIVINTAFEEKNDVQDPPEELQKKKPRTKAKKTTVKNTKVKPNNKPNNIEKEKTIETETKDINIEVREIRSSSPIEVTKIDENSSSKKPKKKGWWS